MRRLRPLAAAVLASPGALAESTVPVMIGTTAPELDACHTVGVVVDIDPRGDDFPAVRIGSERRFANIDEAYTDDALWLCEKRGPWRGVVYAPGGEFADCDVGSPVDAPEPYAGTCRSGWVFDRYLEMTAG